ncbi:MAG: hypothetical protein L3K01_08085 [Thermoplasmata archaeon]|nr:hypothetical protein [Thermoplasmata archaeon]MCI4328768.1 hypothetical protein [Thermoplasmata archaeon]MCI4333659.1 hypothetical protein [Thermoplasmata archaeon]
MGHVVACQCGWTLVSPLGPDDVYEHLQLHVRVHHAGVKASESELREKIRTI